MEMRDFFDIMKKIFKYYIGLLGIIFSILEILDRCSVNMEWISLLTVFLIPLIIILLWFIIKTYYIKYKIPGTDHHIIIRFGNILKHKKSASIIGINTALNTDIQVVDANSIHGQLLDNVGQERLNTIFNKHKGKLTYNQQTQLYEYGEYFVDTIEDKEYVFLVMSDLKKNHGAKAELKDIKKAIDKMFEGFRTKGGINHQTLDCPLLGTGIVDASWSDEDCMKYIIKKYIFSSKQNSLGIKKFKIFMHYNRLFSYNILRMYKLKQYCEMVVNECVVCNIFE